VSESSWAGLAWSRKRQNTTLGIDHCEQEKNDGQETPPSEDQGSPARRFAGQAEESPKVKGADRARAADEVVVAFQPGSVRSPVVLGGPWDGSDKLPTSRS
jgi:hypothetical protein